eukprot:TRINITY_DN23006_c0_g1_i10.p1 TRINITY_DN23006_c0_g1~~TRINITY_DN23006_c0_g1_i10.p1  ORF type:complete len:490 (-),score=70.27 TRINITY_DN23006_c0_g1_i10:215-1684(-)
MSSGGVEISAPSEEVAKKPVVDYDKLGKQISEFQTQAQKGKIDKAVNGLLALEKSQRLVEDTQGTGMAVQALLEILYTAGDLKGLMEHITALSKRRGQIKQVIQNAVKQCMAYSDTMSIGDPQRDELMRCLESLCEGKIFLEIERARLTRRLAHAAESRNEISKAAEIIQELPVETFGAMARNEKVHFILEQVRLCLLKGDLIRAQMLSKKISPKAFEAKEKAGDIGVEGTAIQEAEQGIPNLAELKVQYYQLMIQFHREHEDHYLDICRCYRALYQSETIKDDVSQATEILKKISWYAILSPAYNIRDEHAGSEQRSLLELTASDKLLESQLPFYKRLLDNFMKKSLMNAKVVMNEWASEMSSQADIFGDDQPGKRALIALKLRVVEHNIAVVARYYLRLRLPRLAELLGEDEIDSEKHVCKLVENGALKAKIDRPNRIVSFYGGREGENRSLNSWGRNIENLLDLLEKTAQQVHKEAMVHGVHIGKD